MYPETPRDRGPREAVLSASLTLIGACVALGFFFLICSGYSLVILAVLGGLVSFAFLHYLLWGHSFSEAVAEEREEEQLRAQLGFDDEEDDEWDGPRRRF